MPADPALPVHQRDFPPWQAARLISGAARDAARAWAQPVTEQDILDLTWDLYNTFNGLCIALWRLARFRREAEPGQEPHPRAAGHGHIQAGSAGGFTAITAGPHEPGTHIHRAGSAVGKAGEALRDSEVLAHVRRSIARDLPVGGDPENGSAAVVAARALADAAASSWRIMGWSPSDGWAPSDLIYLPAQWIPDRDAAVAAFMRGIDNLDTAVQNLAAQVPARHAARLTPAQAGFEQAYTLLREALICSVAGTGQPRSRERTQAMRDRYPVLPHRGQPARPGSRAAQLAAASFPGSVIEAIDTISTSDRAARNAAARRAARQATPGHGRTGRS
jgi:hypothetical protein